MSAFLGKRESGHGRFRRRLQAECLEQRTLMSASPWELEVPEPEAADVAAIRQGALPSLVSVNLNGNGELRIEGSNANDLIRVRGNGSSLVLEQWYGGRVIASQEYQGVGEIVFIAREGNNVFRNETNLPSQAFGGAGNDAFLGGSSRDIFRGGAGNDFLSGRGGNDVLWGDSGSDTLEGGDGADRLMAGQVDGGEAYTVNVLRGGRGNDFLYGGGGFDYLYGEQGNDRLEDVGIGVLYGGEGNDRLYGSAFQRISQEMHGGPGRDQLFVRFHLQDYRFVPGDDFAYLAEGRKPSPVAHPRAMVDAAMTSWS